MKKIYAFTLDSDDYPSDRFRRNLRLLAYIMYDYVYNYIGDDVIPLNINKNIIFNNIYENGCNYYLDSDIYDDGLINYEPFLIGERTFALTILDEMINENQMISIMECALSTCRFNYKYSVNSQIYESKNKDDERNREKAVKMICEKLKYKQARKKDIVKKLINSDKYKRRCNCYSRLG